MTLRNFLTALALTGAMGLPARAVDWNIFSSKPALSRGPYLQLATPTSMVVRWRTEKPSAGVVMYGPHAGALTNQASAPGLMTDHVVRIDGLQPGTRYHYAVGSSSGKLAAGPDDSLRFTTPPPAGHSQQTRIWVVGDAGTQGSRQKAVRDAFYKFNRDNPVDLWLMLGNNAFEAGTDEEYQRAVFSMYGDLMKRSAVWPTLGDLDGRSADSSTQSGVYYDVFSLPTRGEAGGAISGTEAYYSFDHANIHFICLNSHDSDRSPEGMMAAWLKADLAATRQDWIIAYWHHPPYTKGSRDSDEAKESGGRMGEMRRNILPILEAGGADLVLSGHSNSYERSFPLLGHYGDSGTLSGEMVKTRGDGRIDGGGAYRRPAASSRGGQGTVYVVAGSSGQAGGGKLNHPAMFISLAELGSMIIDVNGLRLDAAFLDHKREIRDYFTLTRE